MECKEVKQEVKQLQRKAHTLPKDRKKSKTARGSTSAPDVGASSSAPPLEEPSWFKKFQIKAKRAFCFKLDIQDRMYEAHVHHKKAAMRHKEMMRHMGIEHSPEQPRDLVITPKEEWISKHGYWSEEDAPEDDDDPARTPVHRGMGGE